MSYEIPIALQDQWFKTDDEVTHYCGGSTDKEKMNKVKACQTDETKWFHPTKVLEEEDSLGTVECVACQAQVQIANVPTMGE
jgi:hypothetical protein